MFFPRTAPAHSKLNIVYLAELLVVMTDGLKIVRIHAQLAMFPIHGHSAYDDAFLASLSRSRKATVSRATSCAQCARAPSC